MPCADPHFLNDWTIRDFWSTFYAQQRARRNYFAAHARRKATEAFQDLGTAQERSGNEKT